MYIYIYTYTYSYTYKTFIPYTHIAPHTCILHVHGINVQTVSTKNAISPKSTNQETQIPRYLAVQIQIEIVVHFEFVPRNLSISIWWISRV